MWGLVKKTTTKTAVGQILNQTAVLCDSLSIGQEREDTGLGLSSFLLLLSLLYFLLQCADIFA